MWNYQRSRSISNLSPSRRDQPLLVSGTKRATAVPHWLVARRGFINTAQGPWIRSAHEACKHWESSRPPQVLRKWGHGWHGV